MMQKAKILYSRIKAVRDSVTIENIINNMHLRRALLDGAVGASKARTAGAAEVVADAVV